MINKVILLGNVGKDPELRTLDNDSQVVRFSLATSESYKNKAGEKVENTEWHNIVIWGKLAGVVNQYVKKGSKLYLEGKVVTRSYDDKEGNKKYVTEIVCHTMQMLDGAPKREEPINDFDREMNAPAGNPNYKGDFFDDNTGFA